MALQTLLPNTGNYQKQVIPNVNIKSSGKFKKGLVSNSFLQNSLIQTPKPHKDNYSPIQYEQWFKKPK